VAEHEIVVIGAGQAGIASALALKDNGVASLVVDEADQIASRWRARYDRLRLNSSRPTSHLPGRRYPKGTPMFPTRDQVVEHIQSHARDAGLGLQLGTRVERLSRGTAAGPSRPARARSTPARSCLRQATRTSRSFQIGMAARASPES
jgi:cation diffusion facilitator CzcD-associated flavoprotein CzcO